MMRLVILIALVAEMLESIRFQLWQFFLNISAIKAIYCEKSQTHPINLIAKGCFL